MAEQYASIIIDISHENVDRVFQYRIPPQLSGDKNQVHSRACNGKCDGRFQNYQSGLVDEGKVRLHDEPGFKNRASCKTQGKSQKPAGGPLHG